MTGGAAQTVTGGIATFSGLSVDKAGTGFTLVASSSPSLTGATSSTFDISLRATRRRSAAPSPVDAGDDPRAPRPSPMTTAPALRRRLAPSTFSATARVVQPGCHLQPERDRQLLGRLHRAVGQLATTDHIGAHYNGSATHAASTATAFDLVVETHADLADLKVDHGTISPATP